MTAERSSVAAIAHRADQRLNGAKPRKFASFAAMKLAERVGFEPTVPLRVHMISSHAPSTTRSSLRRRNDFGGSGGIVEIGGEGERFFACHSPPAPRRVIVGFAGGRNQ